MENLKHILSVINDINTIQKQIDDINTGRSDEFDLDELEEDLDYKIDDLNQAIYLLEENTFDVEFIEQLQELNEESNYTELETKINEYIEERE